MSSAPSSRRFSGARAWRSLGGRLALWYAFVTIAAFVAVAVILAVRTGARVEEEGRLSAATTLEQYRHALDTGGIDALRALAGTPNDSQSIAVRLTDERNTELLAIASDQASNQASADLRLDETTRGPRRPAMLHDWSTAAARVSENRRLEVVVRNDPGERLWNHARQDLWLVFGIALASAIVGGFVLSRRALRPVDDLAQASQRILDSGDLGLRVRERGAADLDELTRLFNRMLERNETLVRAMKHSLDNVAHDLRTPLTRLRTGAELALNGPLDEETAREALADTIEESERVLGMLTTLMDITEAETGAMRLEKRPEDLASIAREAVELYEHVSHERGVHVTTMLGPGVEVLVDRRRMMQVCANLLDNAIKYTPPGGSVEVAVTTEHDSGVLTVTDTGIGISAEDQPHVWDRLFRGDRSRTERGLGLGLSLVKAVVEAHGGTVELRSDVGKGAAFVIRVPRS
jgi:signal transduction histidine kinase